MACILHLETSTDVCSVALSEDGALLFAKEEGRGTTSHEVAFSLLVDEALSMADSAAKRLDAVALSCGPGSYTGLRISASMAKGICYGRDLPLIALPTLEVTCVPVLLRDDLPEDALLCPMIDARRMEVYAAVYDRALTSVREVAADVVVAETYAPFLDRGPVWFFGGGQGSVGTSLPIPMPTLSMMSGLLPDGCSPLQRRLSIPDASQTSPTSSLST